MGFWGTPTFQAARHQDVGDVCQLRRRPSGANFALSLGATLLPLLRPLLTLVINEWAARGGGCCRACNHAEKTVDSPFF